MPIEHSLQIICSPHKVAVELDEDNSMPSYAISKDIRRAKNKMGRWKWGRCLTGGFASMLHKDKCRANRAFRRTARQAIRLGEDPQDKYRLTSWDLI